MKPGLTKAEHLKIANELREIKLVLQSHIINTAYALGVSHRIGRRAKAAANAVDRLRSELSILYESRFDELSPYYGQGR